MRAKVLVFSPNADYISQILSDFTIKIAKSREEVINAALKDKFNVIIVEDDESILDEIKSKKKDIVGILIKEEKTFDKSKDYYYIFKPYSEVQLVSIVYNSINKEKLEKELRKTTEFLGNIVESSPDSIITCDLEGRITSFNPGAEKILGYHKDEILGKKIDELYPEEEREFRKEWISRVLEGRSIRNARVKWKDKLGKLHDISLSVSLLRNGEGNPIGTVGIGKDISKEVEAERLIQEYIHQIRTYIRQVERASQFKELLLDILRHDILNPLTTVKNVASTLDNEKSTLIKRNIEKIEDIVRRATLYSRLESIEELEYEPVDLTEIIQNVVDGLQNLAKDKGISFILPKGKCKVEVNRWIEEALVNLISNAIKFSPVGETIEITIHENCESITMGIKDRGPGIPKEDRELIFERFGKGTKSRGMGLGLAIVKRLVELHNGKIWVEENKPRGSIFYIRLPKKQRVE